MKMPRKDEFDLYYLIICSRGEGTETITVDKVEERLSNKIKFEEHARSDFERFGACIADADFSDEGYIVCVPSGTFPLRGILQVVSEDYKRNMVSPSYEPGMTLAMLNKREKEVKKEAMQPGWIAEPLQQAFLSALLRVWLTPNIAGDDNPWTSTNGWRKVDIEVLNEDQLARMAQAMSLTIQDFEAWNCEVMKRTVQLYRQGKLPKKPFPGC